MKHMKKLHEDVFDVAPTHVFTNVPCLDCGLLQDQHAGKKCLFSASRYRAVPQGTLMVLLNNSFGEYRFYASPSNPDCWTLTNVQYRFDFSSQWLITAARNLLAEVKVSVTV